MTVTFRFHVNNKTDLQILQPGEHLLHERHPAVLVQSSVFLKRPVKTGHPVEASPHQRPPEVLPLKQNSQVHSVMSRVIISALMWILCQALCSSARQKRHLFSGGEEGSPEASEERNFLDGRAFFRLHAKCKKRGRGHLSIMMEAAVNSGVQ